MSLIALKCCWVASVLSFTDLCIGANLNKADSLCKIISSFVNQMENSTRRFLVRGSQNCTKTLLLEWRRTFFLKHAHLCVVPKSYHNSMNDQKFEWSIKYQLFWVFSQCTDLQFIIFLLTYKKSHVAHCTFSFSRL